ncbi:hypothetical protein GCM10010397_41770 [Streptomyces spinoverrucosus]|nr:hypothetical protein GCM10010397_41770 [Streptomyces spinoverrucosus]
MITGSRGSNSRLPSLSIPCDLSSFILALDPVLGPAPGPLRPPATLTVRLAWHDRTLTHPTPSYATRTPAHSAWGP